MQYVQKSCLQNVECSVRINGVKTETEIFYMWKKVLNKMIGTWAGAQAGGLDSSARQWGRL